MFRQPRLESVTPLLSLVLPHQLTFAFLTQTYAFSDCKALVSGFNFRGVFGKILLDFGLRACTSWFAVHEIKYSTSKVRYIDRPPPPLYTHTSKQFVFNLCDRNNLKE